MPSFVRSDVRANLVHQTKETLSFMQSDAMLQQLMVARSNADAPGWGERSFVYVFALLGFLLFYLMQKHSEYLSEARRTLQRELKEMNAVRVDEDNWHHQVR